tara:strand:- start:1646 stop:1879 length:234 start_codon:yes stop_codon:yes gene_type:complete
MDQIIWNMVGDALGMLWSIFATPVGFIGLLLLILFAGLKVAPNLMESFFRSLGLFLYMIAKLLWEGIERLFSIITKD